MKRVLIGSVISLLLLGVAASPSEARPGEIPATAQGVVVEVLDPGDSWFRGDVLHVRDLVWRSQVIGDGPNASYVTGEQVSVLSYNWNYKTGAVTTSGTWELTLDDFDGGYTGSFHVAGPPNPDAIGGTCAEFPIFRGVGKGFGELNRAQVRWDLASVTCGVVTDYDGTIFFPGG